MTQTTDEKTKTHCRPLGSEMLSSFFRPVSTSLLGSFSCSMDSRNRALPDTSMAILNRLGSLSVPRFRFASIRLIFRKRVTPCLISAGQLHRGETTSLLSMLAESAKAQSGLRPEPAFGGSRPQIPCQNAAVMEFVTAVPHLRRAQRQGKRLIYF